MRVWERRAGWACARTGGGPQVGAGYAHRAELGSGCWLLREPREHGGRIPVQRLLPGERLQRAARACGAAPRRQGLHQALTVGAPPPFYHRPPASPPRRPPGTHCSGTVAARNDGRGVYGVLPGARILPVKILADDGRGYDSDIIAAINEVATKSVANNIGARGGARRWAWGGAGRGRVARGHPL